MLAIPIKKCAKITNPSLLDTCILISQVEIRHSLACYVVPWVVANCHVKDHPGDLSLGSFGWFERHTFGIQLGFSLARNTRVLVDYRTTAHVITVIGMRSVQVAVCWSQVMQVGVACLAFFRESARLRPDMFTLPAIVLSLSTIRLGECTSLVEIQELNPAALGIVVVAG